MPSIPRAFVAPVIPLIISVLRFPALVLMVGFCCGGHLEGASGDPATFPVPITISPGSRTGVLQIPENCTSVVIERRAKPSRNWTRFQTIAIDKSPASLSINLPGMFANQEWQATGTFAKAIVKGPKYPSPFYRGVKTFGAITSPDYDPLTANGPIFTADNFSALPLSSLSGIIQPTLTVSGPVAQESDIWKSFGSTLYFFNQLRGLQVIDLSNPAEPVLQASLRLPASGQDLYVLPGPGTVRHAVLLTNSYDPQASQSNTEVMVIRVDGSSAAVVSRSKITGWMSDSRLVGNRLYLITKQWTVTSPAREGTTLHELVVDPDSGVLTEGTDHAVPGGSPVISAGADWLAVAAEDAANWRRTTLTLFQLDENGATPVLPEPLSISGRVYDKFNIQYAKGILSVISQNWVATGTGFIQTPVTRLQTFSKQGETLATLEITRGEQLQATRFSGDIAYVVTFRQIDPLWVIDLSDPAHPVITGHIEVPGWATHIEPVGDMLFTLGLENGKVVASLFDVSNPASPALLKRVPIDSKWGMSEATYDDQALKVLPDDGLVLVPYTGTTAEGGVTHFVQLLDLDIPGHDLRLRGKLIHEFEPRRATLINGSLASISQRQLVTANIADRDAPVILADLLLAWPVNRLLVSGDFLLEISEGSSWLREDPAVRVAVTSDPDSVLEEIGLGAGNLRDATLQGNKLFVLRQTPVNRNYWYGGPVPIMLATPIPSETPIDKKDQPTLSLDIYDASALPVLKKLSSISTPLPEGETWDIQGLLWPSNSRPVVIVQPLTWEFPGRDFPIGISDSSGTSLVRLNWTPSMPSLYYLPSRKIVAPAQALVFDVSDASTPKLLKPVALTAIGDTSVKAGTAGGGLLVYGYGSKQEASLTVTGSRYRHYLRILDLENAPAPALRPAMDIPGKLFAVTDLTHEGFLAWTESFATGAKRLVGPREVQVSASNGKDAYQVASLNVTGTEQMAVYERSLFMGKGSVLTRYSLKDSGFLIPDGNVSLNWTPNALRAISDGLLGSNGQHLFRAAWTPAAAGNVTDWETQRPADLQKVIPLENTSVLIPAGDYGVDRLDP